MKDPIDQYSRANLDVGRVVDDTTLLLLYLDQDSVLIELYVVLGLDVLKRLIEAFAGTTILVPTRERVANAIRDVRIYRELVGADRRNDRELHNEKVAELALEYGLTPTRIRDIKSKVVNRLGSLESKRDEWVTKLEDRPEEDRDG